MVNQQIASNEEVFLELYQQLNQAQQEAVDAIEGPVMVIAGPGTGKTQILAMRIANILRNPDLQVNASNILCLTFTESATAAMRKRLISIIGSDAYYVRIHTFHSFCNELIKENPHKFLNINPISDLEQIEIFNEIIDELDATSPIKPFGDPYIYRNDLINQIKVLKRESINADELETSIEATESFIAANASLIKAFIERHARSIKDEDCEKFLEELYVKNQDSAFVKLFQDFYDRSSKIAEFKKQVKDFYEKNLREIPKQKELAQVYRAYKKILAQRKLYDFEDMILRVIEQMSSDPEFLAQYQEEFQYILVDEYQDTNGAQNKILELLTSFYAENPNLFVVGDDDQSIYRFQGASLENILYFYKRFEKHIRLVVLDKNYRSQQVILDLAQLSVNHNETRITKLIESISKKLDAAGANKDYANCKTELHISNNKDDEIYHCAKKVQSLIEQGCEPCEITVLFRENKEAQAILDCFARLKIPAKIEAGNNILEDLEINQLLDLLKVIHKPESNSSLIFNLMNYSFIKESQDFKEISTRDIFSLNHITRGEEKSLIKKLLDQAKFSTWAEKIIEYNSLEENLKFDDFLERVVKDFGYLDYILRQNNYIVRVNRLDSLFKELRNLINNSNRSHKDTTSLERFKLKDFINYIELLQTNKLKINSQNLNTEFNAVRLMTAHKSKGLEFENVFLLSCLDKRWGNKVKRSKLKLPPNLIKETGALLNDDANEDERRVFFVALTRAKKNLFLSYHKENEKAQELVPSIFLSELLSQGADMIEKIDYSQVQEEGLAQSEESIEIKVDQTELDRLSVNFLDKADFSIQEQKTYIDSLLENYKLSVTHLNNFLDCPRKFFYQNLLRVPSAKSKHASFGTAVHAALFDLFSNVIASNRHCERSEAIQYLLERFMFHLEQEHLPEQEHQDSLSFGEKVLSKYYENYASNFHQETLLEFDLGNKGCNLDGIELTGKLDKVELLEDKQCVVIDYKTGNPSGKSKALKPGGNYHRQLVFYQLLCDLANKSGLFKAKMKFGEIDFIQQDSKEKFIKHRVEINKEDLSTLCDEIKNMYAEIKAHNFHKTDDLSQCSNCAFKNICER